MKESDIVNAIALGIMAPPEGFKTKLPPRTQFKLVFTKESPDTMLDFAKAYRRETNGPVQVSTVSDEYDFELGRGLCELKGYSQDLPGAQLWCLSLLAEIAAYYPKLQFSYMMSSVERPKPWMVTSGPDLASELKTALWKEINWLGYHRYGRPLADISGEHVITFRHPVGTHKLPGTLATYAAIEDYRWKCTIGEEWFGSAYALAKRLDLI